MARFISYLLIATVAFAAGYYFALLAQPLAEPSFVATSTPQIKEGPSFTTIEVNESTTTYSIDVKYPKFGIPAIDAKVEEVVRGVVAEFKENPPTPLEEGIAPQQNWLTIEFDPPYMSTDVVSFKLVVSRYTGGAHSNEYIRGMNFDKKGRPISLQDALSLIGLSLKQVSVAATAQLRERLAGTFSPEGAEPNSKNFESFVISEDKVTFIFQEYQVASYSAGPQEVSFDRAR